jgi:hypothetical protein
VTRTPALVCIALAACWTSTSATDPAPPRSGGAAGEARGIDPTTRPRGSCPAHLAGSVHDLARSRPIASATVVLSTAAGRVETVLTDATGSFELTALAEPAMLTIYAGELVAEYPVAACTAALRIGINPGT